jgi:sortase A
MTDDPYLVERDFGDGEERRVRRRRSSSSGGSSGRTRSSRGRSSSQRSRRPRKFNRPWLFVGLGLIASGLAVLAWVGWEFWGTNVVSHHRQEQIASKVQQGWGSGEDTVATKFGKATAILHVPRFGNNYAVPVLEGDSEEVLAAGIAHFPHTAGPGQVGNYALAAHRVTHGEPFAKFPHLRATDEVYVETRTATYEYQLDNGGTDLVVPMQDTWVIDPSPVNPDGGVQPTPSSKRLITLVTCSEIFHTDNRSVVFGHLVRVVPKGHAKPVTALSAAPGEGLPWWAWPLGAAVVVVCVAWVLRRRLR